MHEHELELLQRSIGGLEAAIKELREQQSAQQTVLAKIETMLTERSSVWDRSILEVRADVESLKKRLWAITGAAAVFFGSGNQNSGQDFVTGGWCCLRMEYSAFVKSKTRS